MTNTETAHYRQLLLRSFLPDIRMAINVPVIHSFLQGLRDFFQGLKAATLEGQGLQLFPPGFDQVQPTGVLGQEQDLNFGPSRQSQLHLATGMDRQIVFDQQPTVSRKLDHQGLDQVNMTEAVSARAGENGGLSACRFESAMRPELATPTIIRLKGCPMIALQPFFARISLHRQGSHFIDADHPRAGWRHYVRRDNTPLFSTNCGSCFSASWNQLSWRFHSNPSSAIQVQMVESDRCTPSRSSKALCRRSSVHSLKGYPSVFGFCSARLIRALRTAWLWVGLRPPRFLSCNPARPSALKRLTQFTPMIGLRYPTCWPASEAYRLGLSSMATIRRARCTRRKGSVREAANRRISAVSSVVKVRSLTGFRISSS